MTLLDGKSLSVTIERDLTEQIAALVSQGVTPGLAVILVGNNPASCAYVQMKAKACKRVGIYSVPTKCLQKLHKMSFYLLLRF